MKAGDKTQRDTKTANNGKVKLGDAAPIRWPTR